MAKQCIICGQPARSKEHIFPAALGGRRVNKKIYCEFHNHAFGIHVGSLLETLEYFNASLGVRSDHHDLPKPHKIETESGEKYQVLRDRIEIAPPLPLQKTPELVGKEAALKFPNKIRYQEWANEQRKAGFQVELLSESAVKKQFFVEPIKISFCIGSEEYRRAIAYLGLTYLAHYAPDLAMQGKLLPIKSCVLGGESVGDRTWWVDPKNIKNLMQSEFDGIHIISLVISKEDARAYAVVVFFKRLCMVVDLGSVEAVRSECITTHINPLVDSAKPDTDIFVTRTSIDDVCLGSPQESAEYRSKILDGKIADPVGEILRFLQDRQLDELTENIIKTLKLVKKDEHGVIEGVVNSIIEEQSQRILNLLQYGINDFIKANNSLPAIFKDRLSQIIILDEESENGLSGAGISMLEKAKGSIAKEVLLPLEKDDLSGERIKMLFSGGEGIAAALRPIFDDILDCL